MWKDPAGHWLSQYWNAFLLGIQSKSCSHEKQYRDVCYWHWGNGVSCSLPSIGHINPKHWVLISLVKNGSLGMQCIYLGYKYNTESPTLLSVVCWNVQHFCYKFGGGGGGEGRRGECCIPVKCGARWPFHLKWYDLLQHVIVQRK